MGKRKAELYSCSVCPRASLIAKTQTVAKETGRCMDVDPGVNHSSRKASLPELF